MAQPDTIKDASGTMALRFSAICNLLQNIEDIYRRDPPPLPAGCKAQQRKEIDIWFKAHRRAIDGLCVSGSTALLSTLLPERRTDRVYGLQNTGLARLLCRHLCLSTTRSRDLLAFRQPGRGDLADCLERVLQDGGPPALPPVTLGEIDGALDGLASQCKFSAPGVRCHKTLEDPFNAIANVLRRLHPVEAKWFVRLILKDLSILHLDERLALQSIHFLLPDILRFQQDFNASIATLKGRFAKYPSRPDYQSATLLRKLVSASLRPQIGVKVSRSTFCKARSIEQCLKIVNGEHWMIERKYDGEFCEIHIDLGKGADWLKIFSKSGKDSTLDRHSLKSIVKKSLAIDTPACKFKQHCIVLAEMVVFSETSKQILPFHKIRKHISRSGSYIGISEDSPRDPAEHLMLVFFDILLLDEVNVIQKAVEERKALLQSICRIKAGRAVIAESKVLDFSKPDSKRKLMAQLAASVAARHEGLILKPCGRPYLSLQAPGERDTSTMIKLKKDYINGLGDELDMAVIGASHNAQPAVAKGLSPKSFTHFHLGCLMNQDEVLRYHVRPAYRVVGTVSCDGCVPPDIFRRMGPLARLRMEVYNKGLSPTAFDLVSEAPSMDVVFPDPFVFEVLGSSYEKPSDCSYFMLRHPRVKKLHLDRTWRDCVSFADLQKHANQALTAPPDSESQENIRWMDRIERSCRRKIARASLQTTPDSRLTRSPTVLRSPLSLKSPQNISPRRNGNVSLVQILPTPPTSSACQPDRTDSPKRARVANITDVSPTKRPCLETGMSLPKTQRALSDITKQPKQSLPCIGPIVAKDYEGNNRSVQHQSRLASRTVTLASAIFDPATSNSVEAALASTPKRGECAYMRIASNGKHTQCPLSNAAVYMRLPSTVKGWRVAQQAVLHGAIVTYELDAWERPHTTSAPDNKVEIEEVPDSQPHLHPPEMLWEGLKKVYHTDATQVHEAVLSVVGLREGRFDEPVTFLNIEAAARSCCSVTIGMDASTAKAAIQDHWDAMTLAKYVPDVQGECSTMIVRWPPAKTVA